MTITKSEIKAKRNALIKSFMKASALHNSEKKKRYIKSVFKEIDNCGFSESAQVMLEMSFVEALLELCVVRKKPVTLFELERFIKQSIIDDVLESHIDILKTQSKFDDEAKEYVERIESDSILMLIQRAKIAEQFSDVIKSSVETYSDEFWAQDTHICSICQTAVDTKLSHNPEPLNQGRCCENCNEAVVQYRIGQMFSQMSA